MIARRPRKSLNLPRHSALQYELCANCLEEVCVVPEEGSVGFQVSSCIAS